MVIWSGNAYAKSSPDGIVGVFDTVNEKMKSLKY